MLIKRYFITGLLIWVPLGITVWVLRLLIGTMDQSLLLLPPELQPENLMGFYLPGVGVALTLLVIFVTGLLTANIVGQRLIRFWEGVLARIPVVKSIYYSVKQVSDTLFSGNGEAFRKVLLVRYPHPQAWSLAFQTNLPADVAKKIDQEHVGVFIPTTPSPVNGFYFYVKRSETIELDISVDDAFKYIISMGVVVPQKKDRTADVYPGD
jgi:uncharacterized membrane protein